MTKLKGLKQGGSMIRLYEALQPPLSAMNSEAAPAAFEVSAIKCAIRGLHIEGSESNDICAACQKA